MSPFNVLPRPSLASARAVAIATPAPRGYSVTWPSRAGAASLRRLALGLAVVLLCASAVLYPLSQAGGSLARGRGYIVTIDPAAGVMTYQANTAILTVEIGQAVQVYRNGRPVSLDDLRLGDHVLVKYESVWKRTALQIHAIGRRP